MKLIWYIVSIVTILLILINNPKTTNFGNFNNQSNVFNYTRNTQKGIQLIIILNVVFFFCLTIFSVLF